MRPGRTVVDSSRSRTNKSTNVLIFHGTMEIRVAKVSSGIAANPQLMTTWSTSGSKKSSKRVSCKTPFPRNLIASASMEINF